MAADQHDARCSVDPGPWYLGSGFFSASNGLKKSGRETFNIMPISVENDYTLRNLPSPEQSVAGSAVW